MEKINRFFAVTIFLTLIGTPVWSQFKVYERELPVEYCRPFLPEFEYNSLIIRKLVLETLGPDGFDKYYQDATTEYGEKVAKAIGVISVRIFDDFQPKCINVHIRIDKTLNYSQSETDTLKKIKNDICALLNENMKVHTDKYRLYMTTWIREDGSTFKHGDYEFSAICQDYLPGIGREKSYMEMTTDSIREKLSYYDWLLQQYDIAIDRFEKRVRERDSDMIKGFGIGGYRERK